MRWWLIIFGLVIGAMLIVKPVQAAEPTPIYFFWSKTCPYCALEKPVVERIAAKYAQVRLYSFEVSMSRENAQFLQTVGEVLEADISGVPFTVVGERYVKGWPGTAEAEQALERAVEDCLEQGCADPLALYRPAGAEPLVGNDLRAGVDQGEEPVMATDKEPAAVGEADAIFGTQVPTEITLPILGTIKTADLSLPLLTIAIAFLDGLNPCAMWVLLFLISMLLGVPSWRRRWSLGLAFLGASGLVYFVFLAAWLNVMLLVGWVFWVRWLVGVIAVGVGVVHLRDWYRKEVMCVVGKSEQRQKVFARIRAIIGEKQWWVALAGIVLLAIAVNMVELICSFALPAAYAQMLVLQDLPTFTYYGYLWLYILVFMLDDLVVFAAAMIGLQALGAEGRYQRWVTLIGGLLMTAIGLALLFKPEWLQFG